jgi:hypothetical protein
LDHQSETPDGPRLTRRSLLLLVGGALGAGLLTATRVAHAETPHQEHETPPQAVAAVMVASAPAAATNAPGSATNAPAAAINALDSFRHATQAGFVPIDSTLTFGAPTDLASGWDGTLWAIDSSGAPHQYDPVADTWGLHGPRVDAAALIQNVGPAVYFQGSEMFIADGQSPAQAITPRGQTCPQATSRASTVPPGSTTS